MRQANAQAGVERNAKIDTLTPETAMMCETRGAAPLVMGGESGSG
jgi:hypothetical protein